MDRANLLIYWLQVLNNGRVRPDDPSIREKKGSVDCCNETGIVRDSGEFRGLIEKINNDLSDILLK